MITEQTISIDCPRYRPSDNEEIYWRSNSIKGSNLLLASLRAEFDANMHAPKGWKRKAPKKNAHPKKEPRNSPLHHGRIKRLQDLAAKLFETTASDICGPSRLHIHVRPRMIAIYIAKKFTTLSYPGVGRFFGSRDHATIINAYRKIEREIRVDPDLAFDVALLIETFTGVQQ